MELRAVASGWGRTDDRDRRPGDTIRVTVRRHRLRGRWSGTACRAPATTAGANGSAELERGDETWAHLLHPGSCLVAAGADDVLARRRRRLERARGRRVVEVQLPRGRGGRCGSEPQREVVWIDRSALAGLGDCGRGVPAQVAIAALSHFVEPRRRVGVYWSHVGSRTLAWSQRGRLLGDCPGELPWVLLTEPDAAGWRQLERLGCREVLRPMPHQLPALAPPVLLAVGAALATHAAGTFPPEASRVQAWRQGLAATAGVVAVAAATMFASAADRRADAAQQRLQQLRTQLERQLLLPAGMRGDATGPVEREEGFDAAPPRF